MMKRIILWKRNKEFVSINSVEYLGLTNRGMNQISASEHGQMLNRNEAIVES